MSEEQKPFSPTVQDLLLLLGQKEVEVQYERAKFARAAELVEAMKKELDTLRATKEG